MDVPFAQGELFDGAARLEWLPDETLFSLVSRMHVLWGAYDPGRTARLLFGGRRKGTQHDLPGCLDTFVQRTSGLLGDEQEIALGRTLLAYYRHFVSRTREREIVEAMCGGNVSHLKFQLGLLTSRFRANHPLKACLACMRQDVETYGWAYWHLSHQIPGVWCCPEHREMLRESVLKSTGVRRFFWVLPRAEELMPVRAAVEEERERVLDAAARLGRLILGLMHHESFQRIEPSELYRVYRLQLRRLGALTDSNRVRWPGVSNSFVEHVRFLRRIPELDSLAATTKDAEIQLGRLLRAPRSGTHPVRHLVMVDWLYGDMAAFLQDCRTEVMAGSDSDDPLGVDSAVNEPVMPDPRRERLSALLKDEGKSLRAAAKAIGIDVGTAMMWAAKDGISTARRPKALTPRKREHLIALLQKGGEKKNAAQAVGVSIQTVTRVLLTEVGLHETWTRSRWLGAQRKHRQAWLRLVSTHPGSGVKILRGLATATYAWLYRHDRQWLEQNKPAATPFVPTGLDPAIWLERDAQLSAAVSAAALTLAADPARRRLRMWELYQAVPALKPKLRILQRLPLTRQTIERALEWRASEGSIQLALDD